MPVLHRSLFFVTIGYLFLMSANGQQTASSGGTSSKSADERTQKQQKKKALRELGFGYLDWLNNDVPYIITPDELGTNEEREQFIEHFWQLRNPDPDLGDNSFKEEHYRRIAYANVRCFRVVAPLQLIRGSCGAIVIPRRLATILNLNLSIRAAPANIV